jgi:hypothetical protein
MHDTRTASSFFLPWGKIDQDARATKIGWRSVAPISARSKLDAWLAVATTEGLLFRQSGRGLRRAERRASSRSLRQHVTELATPIQSH